ncbi:cytochrome P450 [Streptomyces sp. MNP-20]|uniref:cytochrome P450 n=1 Tax=Streptomyces sp. MNP-20 TaxID=2721165 RepID=UPI001557C3FF|nr:cytochrome P450 [Streptomyces sp. MNP-20]
MTTTPTTARVTKAPGALPLIGHSVPMVRDPLRFLTSLCDHGDLVRIRIGPFKMTVVCDPALSHQVFLDDRTFDKGGPIYDRAREIFGNSLATCEHDQHRRLRRLLQPAFGPQRYPAYAQVMTKEIDEFTHDWREGQVIDVLDEMIKLAARCVIRTLFTSEAVPPEARDSIIGDLRHILSGIYLRSVVPPALDKLPVLGNRRYQQARQHLQETVAGVIHAYRTNGADRGDLLSMIMSIRDDPALPEGNGQGLSDQELTNVILNFLLAGIDTLATAPAWALYLLTRNPKVHERLRAEVDHILPDGVAATHTDQPGLDLTARVITEAMRLYPAGWIMTRLATTDTELGGHPIPKGTIVLLCPYVIHHRPDTYANPEDFDPDRWDRQCPHKPPRNAYAPFGGGARKCIGDGFTMVESTLALATICARWDLAPVSDQRMRIKPEILLRPQNFRVRLTPRTHGTRHA